MKWTYVISACGFLLASALMLGDLGMKSSDEKKVSVPQKLVADPDLKLVTERSSYMRSER
jgi:hypothetical protein